MFEFLAFDAMLTIEQLKKISNKKLRKFYETQNERLNDWLEVDTIVTAIADDVFDSFNPDRDNDGIAEREGGLDEVHEDVEALLPEEERTQRRKDATRAKWAINVRLLHSTLALDLALTVEADKRNRKHHPPGRQDRRRLLLFVTLLDRVPR